MKKRSEVTKPSAESRTVPMFDEASKGKVETVRCGGCGLEQSVGIIEREGGKCMGCKRPIASPVPAATPPKSALLKETYTQEIDRKGAAALAEETENLSQLVLALQRKRVFYNLVEISALGVIDRGILRAYANGRTSEIHRGRLGELIQGRDVVVPDLDGDADAVLATGRDEGGSVTVTWGQETFTPIPYNTFVVGPFSATLTVRNGENVSDALERGTKQLAAHAQDEFRRKLATFIARLKDTKASA